MRARVVASLPIAVATLLYASVAHGVLFSGFVTVAWMVALLVAPYLDTAPFVQRGVLAMVAVFGASGGAAALTEAGGQNAGRSAEILGRVAVTMLMLAVARRFFREPEGGPRVEFGLLTVVFVVCGQRRIGPEYVGLVLLFVGTVIATIRERDRAAGWSVVERNSLRALVLVLGLAACVGTVGMVALPRLARLTQRRISDYLIPKGSGDVGFSDRLRLGASDPLLESNELVLRVYGPHVDYLRGRVYDRYDRGSWDNSRKARPAPVATATGRPSAAGTVEIRGVGAMLHPDARAFFFLPLGARDVATLHGAALVDDLGALRPAEDEPPTPIAFELGEPEFPIHAPTDADLEVPAIFRPTLAPLARQWTDGAVTARAKLAALEQHVSSAFDYTLDGLPPSRAGEPALLNFILHTKRGRCELFASTMALLARTAGVPTRVVGGFRVAEHNAVGGYDVVREKNAHAWVEGWDGTAWRTFDPTPGTEANLRRDEPTLAAAADALLALWDRALELLARASLWQFGVVLGGAVGLLTLIRVVRARRLRRRVDAVVSPADAPLPCLAELEAALAERGYPRPPSEPLERYAERIRADVHASVAAALLDYSALRYGDVGDAALVAARMRACARSLGPSAPPP